MAQMCAKCPVGKKGPQKWKMEKKWRMLQNSCCFCQRTAIENNRGESRRIEENRGESRKIGENRGESRKIEENRGESRRIESRKIEENKKMRGNGREKRQRGKKRAMFDVVAGFAKFVIHFHSVITCFANFRPSPNSSAVFLLFSTFSPIFCVVSLCQRFFTFFPSFSANFCCFPNFSPHFTQKQTEFAGEKRKQYFQEIVPGFSGDFVYVLFHPQNERTSRTRKHIFATRPIVVDVYVFFLRLGVLMYYFHTGHVDQDISSEEVNQYVTRNFAHGQLLISY